MGTVNCDLKCCFRFGKSDAPALIRQSRAFSYGASAWATAQVLPSTQRAVNITYSDHDHTGDGRTKAYAHYRVFEAFRCVASEVQKIDVSIARDRRAGRPYRVTCTVCAQLRTGNQIAASATGDWPYAAIQRAAIKARQQLDDEGASCTR